MIVSLSTAEKLKSAGFPQPELEVGQFWYAEPEYKGGELEHVPLCVVVEKYSTRQKHLRRLTCEKMTGEQGGERQFFAPTESDILPIGYTLFRRDKTWHVFPPEGDDFHDWEHENPAEACAEAYLFFSSIS